MPPRTTVKKAPRPSPAKKPPPPKKKPNPNTVSVGGSGALLGGGLAVAGTLGSSLIAGYTASRALDVLSENPMLLYAGGALALLVLLR